jgi:predicted MFS family arabinose efflux permease
MKLPGESPLLSSRYRTVFIVMMLVVCLFNFADRAVFAVLGQTIKRELGLTDAQYGLLAGPSFAFLYAIAGFPIARFAERISRVRIIAAATAAWSVMTALCGAAAGFVSLTVARFGVGVGEAGFIAPMNSLVGDIFPRLRRSSTVALIMLGSPAGVLVGALVGGWVAHEWDWRTAFLAMGLPGVAVAVLVLLVLREPDRGLVDAAPRAVAAPPRFGAFLGTVAQKPALLFVILGGALAGFASNSLAQFMPIFLQRVHHMDVREAASYYGPISAASLTLGLMVGSFGSEWLARRGDARWLAWCAAAGLAMAPVIYWLAFTSSSIAAATALLITAGALLMLFYGPTAGLIQNMLEPRMRATGAMMFTLLNTVFGSGLAPPSVGWLSDRMAARAFAPGDFALACPYGFAPAGASASVGEMCAAASATGIQHALMVTVCAGFLAAAAYFAATFTLRQALQEAPASR